MNGLREDVHALGVATLALAYSFTIGCSSDTPAEDLALLLDGAILVGWGVGLPDDYWHSNHLNLTKESIAGPARRSADAVKEWTEELLGDRRRDAARYTVDEMYPWCRDLVAADHVLAHLSSRASR